jgi:hypothetical protein
MVSLIAVVVASVVAFVFVGAVALMRGWVLQYLWAWFVVPLWPSAPKLTAAYAIGLSLIWAHMLPRLRPKDDKDDKRTPTELASALALELLNPLVVLLFGWLVKEYLR